MLHSRKDTWSVQTRNLSDSIPHGGEQPLEAIGVGWGALAIQDDLCTPLPNGSMTRGEQNHGEQLELPGEEWPNLQKVTESVHPMPMDGNHKTRNLNKPISSWEVTNQQRQRIKLGAELKQHLFSFPNQQFKKELNELDEASKRLEEAMGRVSQVRWGSARADEIGQEKQIEDGPESDRPVGFSHANMYSHSYKPIGPYWVWISKASAL